MALTNILMVCLGLALLVNDGEGTITAWSAPVIATATGTAGITPAVAEDTTGTITTVTATSGHAGGVTGYAIAVQPNTGQFEISSAGAITLGCGKTLDYETATSNEYVLQIGATDADGTVTGTVTLTLSDVNEAPAFPNTQATRVVEDCIAATGAVTTYAATDPDAGDTLTCSFDSGNTNSDLAIAANGAITVAAGKSVASATTSSYTLVVKCVDNDATPLTGTSTLTLCVGSATNCPASSGSGASPASVSMGLLAMVMAVKILSCMQ